MFGFLVLMLVVAVLTQNDSVIKNDKMVEKELSTENYLANKVHYDNLKRK